MQRVQSLLFNPGVRVWNLRLLIVLSVINIYLVHLAYAADSTHFILPSLVAPCVVILHQLLVIMMIPLSFSGMALLDLCATGLEIVSELASLIDFGITISNNFFIWNTMLILGGTSFGILLLLSTLSISARIATILHHRDRIVRQQFDFLGGCRRKHPPYTPIRILFGRSIARPLVRGESRAVIIMRSSMITAIALSVPAMAIYWIFVLPTTAEIYMRSKSPSTFPDFLSPPGAASVFLLPGEMPASSSSDFQQVVTVVQGVDSHPCDILNLSESDDDPVLRVDCPLRWDEMQKIVIRARVTEDSDHPFRVILAPGTTLPQPLWGYVLEFQLLPYTEAVLLFPGSHVIAGFTWTRRDQISPASWSPRLGFAPPTLTFFTADYHSLQTNNKVTGPEFASLTLYQQSPFATRWLKDTIDSTALNGISNFGGFWTFLNGAFALFFGASILYFMFGRRPMSALGIAHIFQRDALTRQWYEDFPAIRTEGGLPGSKNAGIVAFIRDRLVDIEANPEEVGNESDSEVQTPQSQEGYQSKLSNEVVESSIYDDGRSCASAGERVYMLEEVPRLKMDLGMGLSDAFSDINV
ncbi:hypothetical protein R3P38DRAFT_3189093 [Favolaschia claudopus]|uniref:Transmembrane protein n=1 Tax=Favolaschia claudopus TaxID=2862362 RepID=A0AAW0BV82_9AGAR